MKKPVFFIVLFLAFISFSFAQTSSELFNKVQAASTKHIEKGKAYLEKGKLSKAEKEFNKAIKAWKHAYAAYAYLGIVYYQKRDFVKSKEYFEKSLKEFAEFKKNYLKMKLDYMKEFETKAKQLGIVLDKHTLQSASGNIQEYYDYLLVQKAYRGRSISYSVNPAMFESFRNDYINKYNKLKKEYQRDQKMEYDAFFRFKYGNTLMALRDIKGAIEQYSLALKSDPELKDAYANLSVAYFLSGDCGNAVKYYRIAKKKGVKINRNFERDLKKRCFKKVN